MRISDMTKTALQNSQTRQNNASLSRTIGNGRPMNLMMEVGDADKFKGVTEADTPEHMRPKILDLVRREFVENYGAPSDSTAYRDLVYDYARGFSDDADIKKEVHAMYSLNLAEKDRLQKLAEENFPGWKPGKPFDKDAMWALISGSFDMKV